MTKTVDTTGKPIVLLGDSPLRHRLRCPKPFGAFKAKARTGNSHSRHDNRFHARPNPPRWDRVKPKKAA
jgi:hypothetical protein